MTNASTEVSKAPYVTITHGMRGYFAVLLSWDEECGFHTPWNSGMSSGAHPREVEAEARDWAEAEECELRLPDYDKLIAGVARSAALSARIRELRAQGVDGRVAFRQAYEEFRDEPS